MIMIQAVPPVASVPSIPVDPNLLLSRLSPVGIVMMVLLVTAAVTIVCWPIARALARRLEGRPGLSPALQQDLEDVHHRLADLDDLRQRIADLEERIDFAERMLAQPREPDRLPR